MFYKLWFSIPDIIPKDIYCNTAGSISVLYIQKHFCGTVSNAFAKSKNTNELMFFKIVSYYVF